MNILNSKLQVPKRYHTLSRKRLVRSLSKISTAKLASISAGAGYGKTTLVADALKQIHLAALWYRLDEQDNDFAVFVAYLYAALKQNYSGTDEMDMQHRVSKTGLTKHTETLLEWLAFLEKTVTQSTVIILDDYHLVGDNPAINQAIQFIIDRLPDHIHLILIGRKNPGFGLSKLRAEGTLLEIDEADLAFTPEEIELFFSDFMLPTPTSAKDIFAGTGGWAAGLVLLRYSLEKKAPEEIKAAIDSFVQNPGHIFSYFKENIFDLQPTHFKTFMMKAALLTEINVNRCSKIFHEDNAAAIINKMVDDHLMIFPTDDVGTGFYLHHLFRDFLIDQLHQTFSRREINQLHRRIARELETEDVFQAIHHFLEGRAFDDAIALIGTHERKFLLEGKVNFLGQCLNKLPESVIEKNPESLLAQAKLFSHFGKHKQAMENLTRALQLFKKQKSGDRMVKCLIELGTQYYSTGYIKEAKLLMEQVLGEVQEKSFTHITALAYLTLLSSILCEFETAETYYKAGREITRELSGFESNLSEISVNVAYTYTLYIKGRFKQAYQLSKKILKKALKSGGEAFLSLLNYQFSSHYFMLEEYEKGIEYAKKAIEICDQTSQFDSTRGWIYFMWAQNCVALDRTDQALELIQECVGIFEDMGNRWGLAHAWELEHKIDIARGDMKSARQKLEKGMDTIKGYGLVSTEGIFENSLAQLYILEKKYSSALDCLEHAKNKFNGVDFHMFCNHLLASKACFKSGMLQKSFKCLSQGLALSEKRDYHRFVEKESQWINSLLKSGCSKQITLNKKTATYLKSVINADMTKNRPVLEIKLFGRFKLTIDDKELPPAKWNSSKALMIFKYLAANRTRGFIPREVLIEMLWPEADPKKTAGRFHMAMSALRKTLEPGILPKRASTYIERKKDTYRLYDADRIRIDSEQFSNALILARANRDNPQKALVSYRLALSLYVGSFLEEDQYEDWCNHLRDKFNSDYLIMLKEMADIYEKQDDMENALHCNQKIFSIDSFNETAATKIMAFHSNQGNFAQVKQTYQTYRNAAQELACPVSPDVTALYEKLIPQKAQFS
ncbi:BTAD domain-containing putative transcriptional regulator [uncultured Desulfobacter sp.]|uniref:BTAD domain-containing putative transcriptional regulator n=1 Tax=uncultured Desulfobacter sp. TaxID=240139 RepID=UPI0029F546A5|nr:BTAD domain-containing putative transcriptional regulator [uncultured Desulfobacter sp.]